MDKKTSASNDNHQRSIPVPIGGFLTNEEKAKWMELTINMCLIESLSTDRVKACIGGGGLYEFLLLCLNSTSKRNYHVG